MRLHPRAQEAGAGGQSQGQITLCDEAGAVYTVRAEVSLVYKGRHYVMGLLWSIWGGTM